MIEVFWMVFLAVLLLGAITSIAIKEADPFVWSFWLALLMGIGKFIITLITL